ncbi:MAG TPA: isoprenylcysteine carboxylmethyltransferase family protein [Bryobacteraceae bacterium]|nr:isoprenylcysteine carboxylmethyltransferase family protein [Bryobacteraceae bacterium]
MRLEPDRLITSLWIVLAIVWAVGALRTKRTRQRESVGFRLAYTVFVTLALLLVFKPRFRPGVLGAFFVTPTPAVEWTAVAITALGIAIAIAARVRLGGNWSGTVTVKEGHELIQTGMYQFVRHPIYTGFLLAMLGSAIEVGRIGALLGVAVAAVALRVKSLMEEQFMEAEFGEQYREYRRRVKALIPFVW